MGFLLFGNQLQEMGMTRIEGERRVNVNPLDLSGIVACLQRQLAHTVAYGNNTDLCHTIMMFVIPDRIYVYDIVTVLFNSRKIVETVVA